MSYVGNTPTTQSFISGTDYFNGTGSQTAFTLSRTVASVNDIQAVVNNVVQVPNDAYTISGTTITFTSAPSAGTQNVYVRYLSTTTQAITPSQNTVSWSTLDSNVQQDLGLMYKNKIINGNMVIDQRNAGASVTPSSGTTYTLDRWAFNASQASKVTAQQNQGSVTPPAGFKNYLGITSSSAYSIISTDDFGISQWIEGFNAADLNFGTVNAQTVTISFWVRSSLTGTFGGCLAGYNGSAFRSYPFTYTISAANTWEKKSITVPGDVTTFAYNTTNGYGLFINLALGVGSTKSNTAGSWYSGLFYSATGATSLVGTNGATFYFTGVQLEVGTQATAFSTAGGSYGAELALCQRYYWRNQPLTNNYTSFTSGVMYGASEYFGYVAFPVSMRSTPSFGVSSVSDFQLITTFGSTLTAFTLEGASPISARLGAIPSSSRTAGHGAYIQAYNTSAAWIAFSAEL